MLPINALFVDDDETTQMIAVSVLPKRGVKVMAAFNTTQADAILRREKVDVIVCDVLMPKEDGVAYCQRLRREGNKVPVIFLSALGDPGTISRGIESGAAAYLVKPIDLRDLHRRILTLLKIPAVASPSTPAAKKPSWFSNLF